MNASLLAVLNDAERLLLAETERAQLAAFDEDAAIELEIRIRRARNKYVSQYRRAASAAVVEHGGRGKARPENKSALMKAEAFEEALSRVSRRVAALARQAALELRAERLAAAGAAKQSRGPDRVRAAVAATRKGPTVAREPTGDRALRSPASGKAAGEHPRHGCPAAGEAGQPMSTGRCRGLRCSRLNRLRWGPVGGRGPPGLHGHVSDLCAEHVLTDLAGGCEREAARE